MIRILACLLMVIFAGAAVAAGPPGRITAISATRDGGAAVAGWACRPAGGPPPVVRLSAGGPRSPGQPIASAAADRPAPAGASGCGPGVAAGFVVSLPRAALFRHGGLPVSATVSGRALDGAAQLPDWLPDWRAVGDAPRSCEISDMASLRACFARPDAYDRFVFVADVGCAGAACCVQPDRPPMALIHASGKLIEGNGHVLRRRRGGQFACPALLVQQSADIAVDRLGFDEDIDEPACELATTPCAPTLRVQSAHDVRLTGVRVEAGKGYVVSVWDTDGFAFIHSVVADAGIIGLYVGHYRYGVSRNVVIAGSVIARSRANGLALQGADGAGPGEPVLVMGNVFSGNHWHGLWPVPGVPGGITTGGQVLLADGRDVRFTGNIVANGACGNCKPPQTVPSVEIADQAKPPAGVFGLRIDHNALLGGVGSAVRQNPGTSVTGLVLADNVVAGYAALGMPAAPHPALPNIVLTAPQIPPRADLAASPGLAGGADPIVWCAPAAAPGAGRAVPAGECRAPDGVLALLGYPRPR